MPRHQNPLHSHLNQDEFLLDVYCLGKDLSNCEYPDQYWHYLETAFHLVKTECQAKIPGRGVNTGQND